MQQSNMDDLFKQRLYESEITPPAFVWPAVQQELAQRRRRRFVLFFLTGLVGAVAFIGTSFWHTRQHQPATAFSTESVAVISTPAVVVSSGVSAVSTPETVVSPDMSMPGAVVAPSISPVQSSNNTNTDDAASIGAAILKPVRFDATQTAVKVSAPTSIVQPSSAAVALSAPANAEILVSPVVLAAEARAADQAIIVAPLATLPAAGLVDLSADLLQPTLTQPMVAANVLAPTRKSRHCYNYAANDAIFMADAYIGTGFAQKQWRANTVAGTVQIDRRNSTERQHGAFSGGLRGTLLWKQRLRVSTGLHYDQMVEVFEFTDPFASDMPRRELVVDGRTVQVIDTNNIQFGTFYQKAYNNYGLLDIPLTLGFEMRRGRFGLSLNGGMSVNLMFWKEGIALNETGERIGLQDSDAYRSRAGLSLMGSAQGFFCLRPNWRIFVEPYHRQVLRSVLVNQIGDLQQRYGITGIQVGVTHILN